MKIYIISNVQYAEADKLQVQENDLLVFLNKARSLSYYSQHKNKIVFHRSIQESYGSVFENIENKYVFGKDKSIPDDFISHLKCKYDWNYNIEDGKVKSATTGYIVVKWIQHEYPNDEIILVNFGYDVSKSSYRCPWHNWQFEANQLSKYKHIFTAKCADRTGIIKLYLKLSNWVGDNIYTSAVVENLRATGKFSINVETMCTDLWSRM